MGNSPLTTCRASPRSIIQKRIRSRWFPIFGLTRKSTRLTLKLDVPRATPLAPTLENVWKSANWFEREVFDLYGVVFENHTDLRRIMMPDDYLKYPLRKDFSDDGFIVKPN